MNSAQRNTHRGPTSLVRASEMIEHDENTQPKSDVARLQSQQESKATYLHEISIKLIFFICIKL